MRASADSLTPCALTGGGAPEKGLFNFPTTNLEHEDRTACGASFAFQSWTAERWTVATAQCMHHGLPLHHQCRCWRQPTCVCAHAHTCADLLRQHLCTPSPSRVQGRGPCRHRSRPQAFPGAWPQPFMPCHAMPHHAMPFSLFFLHLLHFSHRPLALLSQLTTVPVRESPGQRTNR